MTFAEALKQQYVAGFVLRRLRPAADGQYLSDYRSSAITHTHDERQAEFFFRLIDANEMAIRCRHLTGYRYEVETVGTTVPGPAPRCCGEENLCDPCRVDGHDARREMLGRIFADHEKALDQLHAYEQELDRVADVLQKKHPIGAVKGIGLLECGLACEQVCSDLPDNKPVCTASLFGDPCEQDPPCVLCQPSSGEYHWPEDERPLLTAADALNAAAEHFLEDAGDDELSGLAVDAVRTEWGTFTVIDGEVS